MKQPFSQDELLIILSAARTALADADIFDELVHDTDTTDEDMSALQKKLISFMSDGPIFLQVTHPDSSIVPDHDNEPTSDYILSRNVRSAWVTVDDYSVWIQRIPFGVQTQI